MSVVAIEKILCVLGQQDIPVIQEQPPFYVDLLDSNVVLFGTAMSGKSNFIKLMVTILHKCYRETAEQIFVLDFDGALAELESLPLVAAYFDNANEEYVKRVFKLMEDQLKDNNKKLKGRNFRDCTENQPIHTTLFIDNVNAFFDEPRYTAYQEKLGKLCRDGLSKGITIVMTASSTKGIMSLMGSFKQKIALEMSAESYVDIFNQKVIPVGNNPGHGFANVTIQPEGITGTFPLQVPYELQLCIADDIHDEAFAKGLEYYFGERTVVKHKRFPEILTEELFAKFSGKTDENDEMLVNVGLDYTKCQPVIMDFSNIRSVAIYGKKGFGKTNLLRRLLKGFIESPLSEYRFVFLDDGREQLKEIAAEIMDESRKKYICYHEQHTIHHKSSQGITSDDTKLSPLQVFIKYVHEEYMDLSDTRRMSNLVLDDIFGPRTVIQSNADLQKGKNTIFVLQSKFLYVNSAAARDFMEVILPTLVARADEMKWIFLFTDVKPINDADARENFHSAIGAAFLLDNIAEFVGERGRKSIFGNMDVKSLKEEYAPCEEGDGYYYSIERDALIKLKFIKEPDKEDKNG